MSSKFFYLWTLIGAVGLRRLWGSLLVTHHRAYHANFTSLGSRKVRFQNLLDTDCRGPVYWGKLATSTCSKAASVAIGVSDWLDCRWLGLKPRKMYLGCKALQDVSSKAPFLEFLFLIGAMPGRRLVSAVRERVGHLLSYVGRRFFRLGYSLLEEQVRSNI